MYEFSSPNLNPSWVLIQQLNDKDLFIPCDSFVSMVIQPNSLEYVLSLIDRKFPNIKDGKE